MEARYSPNFAINSADLASLTAWVLTFRDIVEKAIASLFDNILGNLCLLLAGFCFCLIFCFT